MKNCKIARVFGAPQSYRMSILKQYDYFYIAYDGTCYDPYDLVIMEDDVTALMLTREEVDNYCVPCTISEATARTHVVMAKEDDYDTSAFLVGVYPSLDLAKQAVNSKFENVSQISGHDTSFRKHLVSDKAESSMMLEGKLKQVEGRLMMSGQNHFIGIISYK